MEGPGVAQFNKGWMELLSPEESGHHVYWCPYSFPKSFVAQWQVQNLAPEAGLVIVFFATSGLKGEDIFDASLMPRDGTFDQYTLGDIKSYHISYYANAAHNPARGHANLRKNNTFTLLQQGKIGIPTQSLQVHDITLVKDDAHISLFVDDRLVIDYTDNDGANGPALRNGKIGFRQMKWTHFRYRDFKVFALKPGSAN